MLAKRDLFALLVSAFAVYYGSRSEGAATFDPAFHVPLDEPHHRVGAFALGDAPATLGARVGTASRRGTTRTRCGRATAPSCPRTPCSFRCPLSKRPWGS